MACHEPGALVRVYLLLLIELGLEALLSSFDRGCQGCGLSGVHLSEARLQLLDAGALDLLTL